MTGSSKGAKPGTNPVFGMLLASLGLSLPYLAQQMRASIGQISYLIASRSVGLLCWRVAGLGLILQLQESLVTIWINDIHFSNNAGICRAANAY